MHPKVVSAEGWKTVRKLVAQGWSDRFTLAGGTALALHLGHRYSEDLDFFEPNPFDPSEILRRLTDIGHVVVQSRSSETLHALVDELRLSFLRAQAPLLYPGIEYRGLSVADPRDIAVMKLIAIGGRGSRKDFVDLYFYFRSGTTLGTVFELLKRRFTEVDYNEYHLLKSVVFFDDAENEPMPQMIRDVEWDEVKERLRSEVRSLS